MKKWFAVVCSVLCLLFCGFALADEGEDISRACTWKVNSAYFKATMMTDGKYTTKWQSKSVKHPYVAATAPDGKTIHGIYICFAEVPDSFEIQVQNGEDWSTYTTGVSDYAHQYYEIPEGASGVRVYVTANSKYNLQINELSLFTEGDLPEWVQRWEPSTEKADILFLMAHPDDDLIFLGGAIPTYVTERGNSVAIGYLSYSNTTRRSELLNALWSMGVRNYPYIGTFKDSFTSKAKDAYKKLGGEKKVVGWVADLFRTCKPEVVVTHDPNGEYGHGQHKMLADACVSAFTQATEANGDLPGWQVKKLYQHLAGDSSTQIHLDWSVPLESFGGMTGLEVAIYTFDTYHITQQGTKYDVANTGTSDKYSNERFGLVCTVIGPDTAKNDFLENIDVSSAVSVPAALPTEEPAPEATAEPTPIETEEPDEPEPDVTEEPVTEATAEPVPEVTAAPAAAADSHLTPTFVSGSKAADEAFAPRIDDYPATNGNGFLDSGEYVHADSTNGLWVYISPTLKVIIEKTYDKEIKLYCLEAEIWMDIQAGEKPQNIFYAEDRKTWVDGGLNALENKVVFATNSDYYTYRLSSSRPIGTEIRNREVIRDTRYTKETAYFPNLDTLAFYEDGSCDVHASYEQDAQAYLDNGAYLVYSFGPYLIRGGEINPIMYTQDRYSTSRQPRYSFGMVEPGHYVAILGEGRLKDSKGICLKMMAEKLLARGCVEACNLDGGQTAIMVFMGKQISRIGPYNGCTTARKTNEILAFGRSDLVGTIDFK